MKFAVCFCIHSGELESKPADLATFDGDRDKWQSIYQACGAEVPELTVRAYG